MEKTLFWDFFENVSIGEVCMLGRLKRKIFDKEKAIVKKYLRRFFTYSFRSGACKTQTQYEASITRSYHTIEKGLSYLNYRPGFGHDTIGLLIQEMEEYSKYYDTEKFFYKTALSTLYAYIDKNNEYGFFDGKLKDKVKSLPGADNHRGGVITLKAISEDNYERLVKGRHSMRHFSSEPIDMDLLQKAVSLAQYTPSACNRQGWRMYIIQEKDKMAKVLSNQNGNRGFGEEFDKLLLIVGELQAFNRDREVFQAFIDGGMYAMRVLDSLFYYGIASCPLSGSLTPKQEENVRKIVGLEESEVIIMFVGIGNYPKICQTTKSERHEPYTVVV